MNLKQLAKDLLDNISFCNDTASFKNSISYFSNEGTDVTK